MENGLYAGSLVCSIARIARAEGWMDGLRAGNEGRKEGKFSFIVNSKECIHSIGRLGRRWFGM